MRQDLDPIAATYLELHPRDAARTLGQLEDDELASFLEAIPVSLSSNVLQFITPTTATRCLDAIPIEIASEIIDRMPTSAAAERLHGMDRDKLREILGLVPRASAIRLRIRLRYPEGTLGSVVEPDVLTLEHDMKVAEALRTTRTTGDRLTYQVYVVDEKRRLKGMVDIRRLLTEKDFVPIARLTHPPPVVFNARMSLGAVQNHRAWMDYDNLPAVDRENVFQGVVSREALYRKRHDLDTDFADQSDITATQTALADVFWMAAAMFFAGGPNTGRGSRD